MRIATFNIRHGEARDRKVDLGRTAEVIRALEVDLIALQELDVGFRRSGGVDQPAELADLLGMHVYFFPTLRRDGGEYGLALAARDEFPGVAEPLSRLGDEEPRAAIVAAWNKIGIVTTHLSRNGSTRKVQTGQIAEIAAKLGTPSIVLGDLNQPAKDLKPLLANGFTPVKPKAPLRSMLRPARQIDHILVSDGLKVTAARVEPTTVSDHFPLVADVVIE